MRACSFADFLPRTYLADFYLKLLLDFLAVTLRNAHSVKIFLNLITNLPMLYVAVCLLYDTILWYLEILRVDQYA
jgi:hypothetical protein